MIISKKYKNENRAFDDVLSPDLQNLSQKEKDGWKEITSLVANNIPTMSYIDGAKQAATIILNQLSMPIFAEEYLVEDFTRDKVYPFDAKLEKTLIAASILKKKIKAEHLCIELNLGKETPEAMAMEIHGIANKLTNYINANKYTNEDIMIIIGLTFQLANVDKNLSLQTKTFKDETISREMTPVEWKNVAVEYFKSRIKGGKKTQKAYSDSSTDLNELIKDIANHFRVYAKKPSKHGISIFISDLISEEYFLDEYCKLKKSEIPIDEFKERLSKMQGFKFKNGKTLSVRSIYKRISMFEKDGSIQKI
ncbi:MAG: hypothetical protein J0L55_08380 [Caulobacterales bacterium]|nr:hypothetical protein [Caulobacterales bacterium]